jgi:DNA adenine methylase
MKPFLKWAGGKQQLISQYTPHLPPPEAIDCYYEPFVGSAALFFHLQPRRARLSDRNDKLIALYRVVRDDLDSILPILGGHKNDHDYYYAIRDQRHETLSPPEQAARLIYLNRTCYNGLYRENSSGHFNVPFGRYKRPRICDAERLRAASAALQGVDLQVLDFAAAVADARPGDFVYFDPPYVPLSATSNFTSYNRYGFSADDQRRLAETFHTLSGRGVQVMLSNSDTPLVHELYSDHGYTINNIRARRSINRNPDGRGPITELLILG